MSKKKSKAGRPSNKAYLAEQRWLKNKSLKIARHKKEHPNDTQQIGQKPDYKRRKPQEYTFGGIQKSISPSQQQARRR